MFRIRKPTAAIVRDFLTKQNELFFTYQDLGATGTTPPAGYKVDHTRVCLGEGEEVFSAAKAGLRHWEQFQLGWLEAWPPSTPIREGEVVAIVARSLGVWWLNACKVVYRIDDEGDRMQFGFAYGTLPDHAGTGEERFLVEMLADGTVWFDILAFSRPYQWLARIGYPYMRMKQKQFGKESSRAMLLAVERQLAIANDSSHNKVTS